MSFDSFSSGKQTIINLLHRRLWALHNVVRWTLASFYNAGQIRHAVLFHSFVISMREIRERIRALTTFPKKSARFSLDVILTARRFADVLHLRIN